MGMDYNRVAMFVEVVRSGGFTAAATGLGLPKSSLSRSVSRLEEDLGVRLMHRTTRKLALTEVGQAYYDAVRSTFAVLEEADALAREHDADPRGTVRVTAAPDHHYLPRLFAEFRRSHPNIRLELMLTGRYVDLLSESVDIAIRAGQLEDSSLVVRRIGASPQHLMASPAYLRRRGKPKAIADLAEHDWVLFRATNGRASLPLTGPGGDVTLELEAALTADDIGFCCAAVAAGAGIGCLPVTAARPALQAKALEAVLPEWKHRTRAPVHVVLPSGRFVPRRVAVVRDFLIERLTEEFGETERECAGK